MTGLKNFFEVFIAVGSWHSYFVSPEPESLPSTHSFCNVSQSHLLKYTLTHKNHKISIMHLIHFRVSRTVSSIQCLKWIFLWKQNSILQTSTFSVRIVIHVLQPRPFVFHCGINKVVFAGYHTYFFGLKFICISWPIGTPLMLILSNTISFLFLCEANVQEAHWKKQNEIHS